MQTWPHHGWDWSRKLHGALIIDYFSQNIDYWGSDTLPRPDITLEKQTTHDWRKLRTSELRVYHLQSNPTQLYLEDKRTITQQNLIRVFWHGPCVFTITFHHELHPGHPSIIWTGVTVTSQLCRLMRSATNTKSPFFEQINIFLSIFRRELILLNFCKIRRIVREWYLFLCDSYNVLRITNFYVTFCRKQFICRLPEE